MPCRHVYSCIHVFGFGSLPVIITMRAIWCISLAFGVNINHLKAELNPICHLFTLLGAHLIFHVSRIRVNMAAVTGGVLALSSTAIVLQVLQEKRF